MAGHSSTTANITLLHIKAPACTTTAAAYPEDAGTARRSVRLAWIEERVCAILTRLLVWLIGIRLAGSRLDKDVEFEKELVNDSI